MAQRQPTGIRSWPEEERPREKLAAFGPGALTPSELLAILIRTGDPRGSLTAVDLARELWGRCGGRWSELRQHTAAELAALPGMGPAKAAAVAAALEIGRRLDACPLEESAPFRTSRQVYEHYAARLADARKEQFFCLLLDARNRLLREDRVSEGTLTASLVHPREAFRSAVREAASAVIFAHNHPSGDPSPSRDDVDLTQRLGDAGRVLGIRVLDHVIVGRGQHYSFADEGALAPP